MNTKTKMKTKSKIKTKSKMKTKTNTKTNTKTKTKTKLKKYKNRNQNRNKNLSIAEAIISTYLAAQKAYTSQLTLTPDSPIRASIAAAVTIAISEIANNIYSAIFIFEFISL